MDADVFASGYAHQLGDAAMRPIARFSGHLAALHPQGVRRIRKAAKPPTTPLLLLAGPGPLRALATERALPDGSKTARSGAFN